MMGKGTMDDNDRADHDQHIACDGTGQEHEWRDRYGNSVYGVSIAWCDTNNAFIVAGHGRRSYAAVNNVIRGEWGPRHAYGKNVKAIWVVLVDTCGCTVNLHDMHVDDDIECVDDCEHYGLPPCCDDYTWKTEPASAETPGAVPVLEVRW
jgi:hypothetical protein